MNELQNGWPMKLYIGRRWAEIEGKDVPHILKNLCSGKWDYRLGPPPKAYKQGKPLNKTANKIFDEYIENLHQCLEIDYDAAKAAFEMKYPDDDWTDYALRVLWRATYDIDFMPMR